LHTLPHLPQLFLSLLRLKHLPEQAVSPALHWTLHWLSMHVAAPLVGAGQTLPQAPQLARSLLESTHLPPQGTNPALHTKLHWPPLQRGAPLTGALHALSHAPQLEVSVAMSAQPLAHGSFAPQSCWHAPDWHTCPLAQAMPHLPQLAVLELRLTHLPPHSV
jgi:hypothetical protein